MVGVGFGFVHGCRYYCAGRGVDEYGHGEQVSASSASVFTALMPVRGVILSVVFLHEVFHWYHALRMALVLVAMGLITFENKPALVQAAHSVEE